MTTILTASAALLGPDYTLSGPVAILVDDGIIQAIDPAPAPPEGQQRLAMPSLADAHNHARPLSTTSFGCGNKPLEQWLPQLAVMPAVDAYTAAAASFARSLQGGATGVMVHLTRPMGYKPLPEEARDIARAAQDVGVSIGFALSMRDRNPLVYGDDQNILAAMSGEAAQLARDTWLQPLPSIDSQLALVDAVADAVADLPNHVDVQYGPTGVQWCSDDLLAAVAEASQRHNRRVHMHLLETKPQRDWADQTYPKGVVAHLDAVGFLSPRLTLAHGVWARRDELALIAKSGARIAVNNSSNMHLFSGRAPVADMLRAGVPVAMGLDGCALDEDDDGLRELRLLHLLGRESGFDETAMLPERALTAACRTGRAALGLPDGGYLAVGMPADILMLDLDRLDRDRLMSVSAKDLMFARATAGHICEVYAQGRHVLDQGRVTGVNLDGLQSDLRDMYRKGLPEKDTLRTVWREIESAIGAHYTAPFKGCC